MVDVDLPLMLSLSPEPDSPSPITISAKSSVKGSIYNEVSFLPFSIFSWLLREPISDIFAGRIF